MRWSAGVVLMYQGQPTAAVATAKSYIRPGVLSLSPRCVSISPRSCRNRSS